MPSPPVGYWSAYNEMPSPKTYGETAAEDGKKAFEAHLGKQFVLEQPGQMGWVGASSRPTASRWVCSIRFANMRR